jgi:hypothetical protein
MTLVLTDIAVGAVEGDKTGDKARVAFEAINANNALIEAAVDAKVENPLTADLDVGGYAIKSISDGDIVLAPDGTGVAEQRNSTTAQTSFIYNTFTDGSNYERGYLKWSGNTLKIGSEAAGTGTVRNVQFEVGAASVLHLSASAVTAQRDLSCSNNELSGFNFLNSAVTSDGAEGSAGKVITNRGASGTVTRTLQTYTTNIRYVRIASELFRIEPPSGKAFLRADGTLEDADKYLELASDGAMIHVHYDGVNVICLQERGTINVEA